MTINTQKYKELLHAYAVARRFGTDAEEDVAYKALVAHIDAPLEAERTGNAKLRAALEDLCTSLPDVLSSSAVERFRTKGKWAQGNSYALCGHTETVTYYADDMESVYAALDAAIRTLTTQAAPTQAAPSLGDLLMPKAERERIMAKYATSPVSEQDERPLRDCLNALRTAWHVSGSVQSLLDIAAAIERAESALAHSAQVAQGDIETRDVREEQSKSVAIMPKENAKVLIDESHLTIENFHFLYDEGMIFTDCIRAVKKWAMHRFDEEIKKFEGEPPTVKGAYP